MTRVGDVVASMMSILAPGTVLSPADEAIMRASLQDQASREQTMRRAWAAYYGHLPKPLTVRAGQVDDNIRLNRVRPVVAVTTFCLWGRPPVGDLPDAPGSPPDGDPQSEALEDKLDAWKLAMGWDALLLDTGINASVCGDFFWRFLPPAFTGDLPRVQNLDPVATSILWHPRDWTVELGYLFQYDAGPDGRGRPQQVRVIFSRDDGGTWWITEQVSTDGGDWQLAGEPTKWAYAWCPILHAKNLPNPNSPYGLPDVTDDLIDVNKARNLVASNANRMMRLHAHPKVWLRGMGNQRVDFSLDAVINIPGEKGEIGQLVPAVSPEAGDVIANDLDNAVCEMTATPAVSLGRPGETGDPSGVALLIKFMPLQQKTLVKRTLAGPAVVEAWRRVHEMLGDGADCRYTLKWRDVLPADLLALAQTLDLGLTAGYVSKQTAAEAMGHDWTTEEAHIQAEAARAPAAIPPPGPPPYSPANTRGSDGRQTADPHAGGSPVNGE